MTFAGLHILPSAIAHYGKAHPDVSISLGYQPTQDQKVSLTRGELDIGLMLGPYHHSEFDVLSHSKNRCTLAFKEPVACCHAC